MTGYDTDLTDNQWNALDRYFPKPEKMGLPKTYSTRAILNAIFYIDKTGCHWRMLPNDFPPWPIVYYYFSKWTKSGLLDRIHGDLRRGVRAQSFRMF